MKKSVLSHLAFCLAHLCAKPHPYHTVNNPSRGKSCSVAMQQLLHRVVAILALAITCNGMWAAEYVFMSGSNYIIINNSGAITTTTTFNPSTCLWSGTSGGAFTNNGKTLKYSQNEPSGTGTFYYSTTLNTTGTDVPLVISDDGTIQFTANVSATYNWVLWRWNPTPGIWYIQNDNGSIVASTTSNAYNIKAYEYKTFPSSTKEPKITGNPNTYSETGQTGNFNHTDALFYSSCIGYSTGDANYYWYDNILHDTAPSSTEGFTYTWSLSSNISSYASVDNTGKVTYNTLVPEKTVSAELICTATHTSGATNTAKLPLTFRNDGVLAKPTIEITPNGNTATVTITGEEGTTIYYTTDGNEPSETSSQGTSPVTLNNVANQTVIKAFAKKDGYSNSIVAVNQFITSGVSGGKVILNDYEDHNWTYYQPTNKLPDGYPATYLNSPAPRNVKITYRGGGVDGASDVAISGLSGEGQNEMIYYKTLEKTVLGMTGDYPYQVISNPFSKRPRTNNSTGNNGYYGFAGWKVISGAEYIQRATGKATPVNNTTVLDLDETINIKNLDTGYMPNCTSGEIVFEATWTPAEVKNYGTAFTTNGTYETRFWIINSNITNDMSISSACTITAMNPDGTTGNYNTNTIGNNNNNPSITTTVDNVKIEFVKMQTTGNVDANGKTFTIGRGVTNSKNGGTIYGINTNANCVNTVKIESGTYDKLYNFGATLGTNIIISISSNRSVDQLMILGCDYDRAKANSGGNDNLTIRTTMYVGDRIELFRESGECYLRTFIKSGKFLTNTDIADASVEHCYYYSVANTQNLGHRHLEIEGGELKSVAGGIDDGNDANKLAFTFRMRGGTLLGSIYGAAAFAETDGIRRLIFTGGTVNGWIAGGCNGVETDQTLNNTSGVLPADTYLYIGGNSLVKSSSNANINSSPGGYVFGAGVGREALANAGANRGGNTGQIKTSYVTIADNTEIEHNVYAGGNYGYCSVGGNIYITGGTVHGRVFGGANQNKGVWSKIYMDGGLVEGGIYGGSNATGTMSEYTKLQINGGQVGQDATHTANVHGGGYGKETKVSGNVVVTLGQLGQKGATLYGNVYGGSALGQVNTNADNHTWVTMNSGTIHGSIFGGGMGELNGTGRDATPVDGEGVVNGAIKVVVNGTDPTILSGTNNEVKTYAVDAVFGGCDMIAYNGTPVVEIHNCESSIDYVYGGGNASNVQHTDVTVWGGDINYVFGGGNGEDTSKPGANIVGTSETDKGNTNVKIYGGTINYIFGGSNTLGNVTGTASVLLDEKAETGKEPCPILVQEAYGGANKAPMAGTPMLTIGCLSGRLENVYGGSKAVDVNSDIVLYITSGQFGKVFGGNNESGAVNGSITVNIDETGCHPIIIDELYAGGNLAPYTTPSGKAEPTVNVISCSHIGQVFGGGYGASAIVTGNPIVNINQIAGKYDPDDQDGSDGYTANTNNKLGTIGTVFGGGYVAKVVGDTHVNIGTLTTNKHLTTGATDTNCGANISGNVYGGGNQADVTGKTHVQVGPKTN